MRVPCSSNPSSKPENQKLSSLVCRNSLVCSSLVCSSLVCSSLVCSSLVCSSQVCSNSLVCKEWCQVNSSKWWEWACSNRSLSWVWAWACSSQIWCQAWPEDSTHRWLNSKSLPCSSSRSTAACKPNLQAMSWVVRCPARCPMLVWDGAPRPSNSKWAWMLSNNSCKEIIKARITNNNSNINNAEDLLCDLYHFYS